MARFMLEEGSPGSIDDISSGNEECRPGAQQFGIEPFGIELFGK